MNSDILFAFSAFQLILLILDIYILMQTGRDIARKGEYTWLSILIVTHEVYLVCNSILTLHEYDMLQMQTGMLMLICTISLWSVTNCASSFFMFAAEKLRVGWFMKGAGRWLRYVPALASAMLILTNPWTGLVFTLGEDGSFIHQKYYVTALAIAGLYLLVIAVLGVLSIAKARTTFQRQSGRTMLCSVLVIIIFILLDGLLTKASILPAAVFAVIVMIFIDLQDSNINSDALTGMNNRRKAGEYLSDRLLSVSDSEPVYLYMGDLDGFKGINDTYGHTEGDEALVLCSRALKRTISKYNGFAARYGGDEFILSWQPDKGMKDDPELLVRDVNRLLKEQAEGKPYQLSMSMGYVRCTDPKRSLSDYIKEADRMLYTRKPSSR